MKYGSVDEVIRRTNYSLPMSYPGMHHLIKRWGIIKSAGPNSKLSEALTVLTQLSDSKIPLERLYKNLPPSFKTSLSTMHRILHNVKEGVIRRYGTALVVTREGEENNVLTGIDKDHNKNLTLPMTYSIYKENPKASILRVLQQEVFTELAVEKKFPFKVIPKNPKPFMFLNIADIKVAVYLIKLNKDIIENYQFTSQKIYNHAFISCREIKSLNYGVRAGVENIVSGYERYLKNQSSVVLETSDINLALLQVWR